MFVLEQVENCMINYIMHIASCTVCGGGGGYMYICGGSVFCGYTICCIQLIQMSCCKFWPDESERSVKYGYLMVNHTATTAKPDWGMTTLQVLGKSEVQATSTLL